MSRCELCPRHCAVERKKGQRGYCGAGLLPKVALVSLHEWEEPIISGKNGAGTVFFSHCNLRCEFCQNYEISSNGKGIEVSVERLSNIFLEQQERGASCLELVTPTPYLYPIVEALQRAKKRGLTLTVVYNTNAYVTPEAIELCRGLVDVFLPDLKYSAEQAAISYSHAPHYFAAATAAIEKMFELTGKPEVKRGLLKKGVLVRHLVLPWLYKDSMKILKYLFEHFGNDIYLTIMNQYTPAYNAFKIPKLNRRLTTFEYQKVVDYALNLGFSNCFVQEKSAASENYIPHFDGAGVL